jgi:soluble lytic murein transglycosylase-like protein
VSGCAGSTTSTTPAPEAARRALAACALALLAATPAAADLVVLVDGGTLKVSGYRVEGDLVLLELAAGGQLTLSIERIDRVVPDEVLAREPESAPAPPPAEFVLRFVEGHSQPDTPYGGSIWESARRHGLNPSLVAAVARVESRFDPRAVSQRGARGLMQLMPATGRRLGLRPAELFDPEKNLDAGARYLRELADRFGDDLSLVLAAYNAGEHAVLRWGGVPPYRETVAYLSRIYAALGLADRDGT